MTLKKHFYKNNRLNFILASFSLLYSGVAFIFIAVLMQKILDIATTKDVTQIKGAIFMSLGYVILLGSGWLMERYFRNRFIEKALKQYKDRIFTLIMQKNISFFAKESTGRYISGLTNDVNSIENNYLQSSFTIFLNGVYFIFALAVMLWYHIGLTVFAIGISTLTVIVSVLLGGKLATEEKKVSRKNEDFISSLKDFLGGFFVIKCFKAENETVSLLGEINAGLEHTKCRRRKTEGLINLIGTCMGISVSVGIMLFGVYLVIQGQITIGVLAAFIQLMNFITQPVQAIPPAFANQKAAKTLIEKMEESLFSYTETTGKLQIAGNIQNIELQNVSFGYEKDEKTLKDISFTFEQGKCYAIVGASGSGKSTLLHLLAGSFNDYSGSVTYQSKELRDICADSLFDTVSVIWQNVYIFSSSIQNNITMFKEYEPDIVENSVKRAGFSELITEKGYDYLCGENGSGLSGGEKQRIAIARSLLKNTKVILIDEATSSLDTATASIIENTIINMEGITRIVVTHKTDSSILSQYDCILVLQDGKIINYGSFDELMNSGGYFLSVLNNDGGTK